MAWAENIGFGVLFALGAILSQFAEWIHLHYLIDYNWGWAYGASMLIAAVEYLCSVNANRFFYNENTEPFLLQVLWNTVQQITINIILVVFLHQKYNWLHVVAAALLVGAVVCAALAQKQSQYHSF